MANKYQRRDTRRSSGGLSRQLMIALIAFFSGYLMASYAEVGRLGSWIRSQAFQHSALVPAPQLAHQHTPASKPKLEFYTLLTANHGAAQLVPVPPPVPSQPVVAVTTDHPVKVVAANSTTVVQATAVQPTSAKKGNFTIQVAAFRLASDADRMKASLLLKGFDAKVSPVASQGVTWYRVRVGPFASHEKALQTQLLLARRERVNGMIRKMDA